MKVTKVELWNDTGFVDGAAEVPSIGATLPTADITVTDELRPSKEDLFSRLKLSAVREQTEETTVFWTFEDLVNVSYVAVKYDRFDYTIYGWVDNVLMISDSPTPVTAIDWHIDYWRTFISSAKFGYGLVQKRPRGDADPLQNCHYRYRTAEKIASLIPSSDLYWGIINLAVESSDNQTVKAVTLFAPVRFGATVTSKQETYWKQAKDSVTYRKSPDIDLWIDGTVVDVMGFSVSSVSSVFISPVSPVLFSGSGVHTSETDDPVVLSYLQETSGDVKTVTSNGYSMFYVAGAKYHEHTGSLSVAYQTDDTVEYAVTDLSANTVMTIPWGRAVKDFAYRLVVDTSTANIEVRFNGIDSCNEGLRAVISVPPVNITKNSWSDYVFSGQREYDIGQRKLAAQQALVGAVTGSMGSAFQTGVFGGIGQGGVSAAQTQQLQKMMMKQYRGDKGASQIASIVGGGASSALRSGAGMLGVGLASAAIDYAATSYFNGRLQSAEDMLQAKQIDTIQISGNGWDWKIFGRDVALIALKPDDYSALRFAEDIDFNGVSVSEPTADCTALIKTGGPLKIQGLIVTGDIPPQAKNYIANRLGEGVRMTKIAEKTFYLSNASAMKGGIFLVVNDLGFESTFSVYYTDGTNYCHRFLEGEMAVVNMMGKNYSYTEDHGSSGTIHSYGLY